MRSRSRAPKNARLPLLQHNGILIKGMSTEACIFTYAGTFDKLFHCVALEFYHIRPSPSSKKGRKKGNVPRGTFPKNPDQSGFFLICAQARG